MLFNGRKKKWPSLFGKKNKGTRGRSAAEDDGGYASELVSDVRMKELEQVQYLPMHSKDTNELYL